MKLHRFRIAALGLLALTTQVWSAKAVGEYDKDDLRFYYGIGTDVRFTPTDDIDAVLTDGQYILQCGSCYIGKDKKDTIAFAGSNAGHPSFSNEGWGLFGDTKAVLPAFQIEAGAFWHQLQFGFQVSHAFTVVSKAPTATERVDFSNGGTQRITLDTAGTRLPTLNIPLRDAEFSTTSYSMLVGYQLLPATAPMNLAPRMLVGLTSVNGVFGSSWGFYDRDAESSNLKPYTIRDREYNSLGWHVALEPELSFNFGPVRLSGSVGYRFEGFNEFLLAREEETNYFTGKNGSDISSYYGAFRVTYVLPSVNSIRGSKPARD